MKIENFKMERWQSQWENIVTYNLSESGVHPISLKELISEDEREEILNMKLGYIQTDGSSQLKEMICKIYPGTNRENILVTTGTVEANFLLMWSMIVIGVVVLFMLPNYMQMAGLMRAFGAEVKTFALKETLKWNPDPDDLKRIAAEAYPVETKLKVFDGEVADSSEKAYSRICITFPWWQSRLSLPTTKRK